MPQIVFDQVEKSYGSVRVLPPLDLSLNDGEFTVLVGPSGCGKSTTLRILAGLETLSGGEIFFDGAPIGALEPKERDIAMVFQDYALYPHMNIAKNMSFALRLQKAPKSEITEKVQRVADMLNIGHLLDRKPAELSGGQRQRVAMGRALVRDAGTFLFDEPLSNLDAKLRGKMRTELAEMRDTIDKNMVYVTHDQVEAMTLGDRIVVMNEGTIQQQGSPEELFKSPVNMFVAGFIGSPTMNFMDGALQQAESGLSVTGDGYTLPLTAEDAARLHNATSRDVVVGLRPSSFERNASLPGQVALKVVVAEYLGAQSVLVTHCGQQELLVEMQSAAPLKAGTTETFGIRTDEIMIFDKASGLRL
ncbi:ABC transporter ATP-binding protein [Actibacterium sp. 188UL27-1]|uniref:ABC transporter ATP-binding protein n=1 Tax=Actibacterium sp. 188UL27-1 TaxID=2786961 RepID=UPI001959FB49|nr:ABC transporter ATP-binding protein [Actibacterium sp. 188UL27-1]MBM7066117.1 ABC transporter ATP-binding protein [Actibacterium sp. 188UL27-1]